MSAPFKERVNGIHLPMKLPSDTELVSKTICILTMK